MSRYARVHQKPPEDFDAYVQKVIDELAGRGCKFYNMHNRLYIVWDPQNQRAHDLTSLVEIMTALDILGYCFFQFAMVHRKTIAKHFKAMCIKIAEPFPGLPEKPCQLVNWTRKPNKGHYNWFARRLLYKNNI